MFKSINLLLLFSAFFIIVSCQEEDAEGLIQEARAKMQTASFKEAVSLLNGALVVDKENADALNMRGVAKVNLEQYSEALKDFDAAIAVDGANYKYYYNRGNLKRNISKPHDAIADYSKALELDSTQYGIWLNRALCYTAIDEPLKALGDFAGTMRNGGRQDAAANFYYGKFYMTLESYETAVEAFETCVSIEDDNAEGHYMLGLAQLGAGMPQTEACQHFDKAITLGYEEARHLIEEHCGSN